MVLIFEHMMQEAKRIINDMLARNPNQLDARFLHGTIAASEHNCALTSQEMEWCAKKFPSPFTTIVLAIAAACCGDKAAARAYLKEAQEPVAGAYVSPYQLALTYAGIGDNEMAVDWLEKSAARKEMKILYLKYETEFDPLRKDPRFIALEKRVGIEPLNRRSRLRLTRGNQGSSPLFHATPNSFTKLPSSGQLHRSPLVQLLSARAGE